MNYSCIIVAPGHLKDIFEVECGSMNRSTISAHEEGSNTIFTLTAQDPVALRSSMNLISKLLIIYDKMEHITK